MNACPGSRHFPAAAIGPRDVQLLEAFNVRSRVLDGRAVGFVGCAEHRVARLNHKSSLVGSTQNGPAIDFGCHRGGHSVIQSAGRGVLAGAQRILVIAPAPVQGDGDRFRRQFIPQNCGVGSIAPSESGFRGARRCCSQSDFHASGGAVDWQRLWNLFSAVVVRDQSVSFQDDRSTFWRFQRDTLKPYFGGLCVPDGNRYSLPASVPGQPCSGDLEMGRGSLGVAPKNYGLPRQEPGADYTGPCRDEGRNRLTIHALASLVSRVARRLLANRYIVQGYTRNRVLRHCHGKSPFLACAAWEGVRYLPAASDHGSQCRGFTGRVSRVESTKALIRPRKYNLRRVNAGTPYFGDNLIILWDTLLVTLGFVPLFGVQE